MGIGNFNLDVAYEQSQLSRADTHYRKTFKPLEIIRYPWGEPEGTAMQIKDIDCTLVLSSRKANISEKFYRTDYGDFRIEILSGKKPGWALTTKADVIAVFHSEKVHYVNAAQVSCFANRIYSMFGKKFNTVRPGSRTTILYEGYNYTAFCNESEGKNGEHYDSVFIPVPWKKIKELNINFIEKPL